MATPTLSGAGGLAERGVGGGDMRVLVACEFSGVVRDAFAAHGHDAWSCDLLPSERAGQHMQCDIRDINLARFDLLIAHPPCTYLAASGARWWAGRQREQAEALAFVRWLLAAPVPRLALENPVSCISTHIRKPDQIVQPYMFGHPERKTTCLWLRGLPPLMATHVVEGREQRCWKEPPHADRWRRRSRTYEGLAEAFASQWGAA